MIIVGVGMNYWFYNDMNYRGLINMLIMCGCVGQIGGGWVYYVGQEKLCLQIGWQLFVFGLDWSKLLCYMNGILFFYFNIGQWCYEKLQVDELLLLLVDVSKYSGSLVDLNLCVVCMGWLLSILQLDCNLLQLVCEVEVVGVVLVDYVLGKFKDGLLDFVFVDLDVSQNYLCMMFIWCLNLFGFLGKGYEYMLWYLLGMCYGLQGKDLGEMGVVKLQEVKWCDEVLEGKLDLLVMFDFCMCIIVLYLDIVLLMVIWYEKDDFNILDMYFFIYLLLKVVDFVWELCSDWDIFKEVVCIVSEMVLGVLGVEKDLVLVLILYDIFNELGMLFGVVDWKKGECEVILGQIMLLMMVVECDYLNLYCKFILFGLLLDKQGNGGKGMSWDMKYEVEFFGKLNYIVYEEGVSQGCLVILIVIDVVEVILYLVLEINGYVVVKVWELLGIFIGCEYMYLVVGKEYEVICFCDIQVQLCKIIFLLIWLGLEDDNVSYNVGYINVYELILWCMVIGCQQFYQDYEWMIDFGEVFMSYWLLVNMCMVELLLNQCLNGNKEIVLNWIILYQKWGIYSIYSDNLIMQMLLCGGLIVWISEDDVCSVGIVDNDWIELFNVNGVIVVCVVVSQCVMLGMVMMYYVQECIINVLGLEIFGIRGGIYNLVICIVFKFIYMIGGYVQLVYGFNYYGICGINCDEFVIVCKMDKIDWFDDE